MAHTIAHARQFVTTNKADQRSADLPNGEAAGHPYRIEGGRFGHNRLEGRGDTAVEVFIPLSNFTACVVEEQIRDDGLEQSRQFRIEGQLDPLQLEFAFDAQTSGGLLISVAAQRAEEVVQRVTESGSLGVAVIGEVQEKQDVSLILRP